MAEANSSGVDGAAPQDRSVLIVYGTETGNSQEIAEHLGRMCERLRFQTWVDEMDNVRLVCGDATSTGPAHLTFSCFTAVERPALQPHASYLRPIYHRPR